MGGMRGSVSSKFLVVLNVIYTILGAAIVGLSICFYMGLSGLTSLRNESHFQLQNEIHWIETLPWIYVTAGVFVVLVCCCGFLGVMKKSKPLVLTTAVFQILTILLLAGAATVSMKYADTKETDKFIQITVTDAFNYMRIANKPEVEMAFQSMEINLQCCGSIGPKSYYANQMTMEYPTSCCKAHRDDPVKICPQINQVASSRNGCIDVAIHRIRIACKMFAAGGIVTAFVGVLNLVSALFLTFGLSNRKKMMKAKLVRSDDIETHKSQLSSGELDTLKMPLKV